MGPIWSGSCSRFEGGGGAGGSRLVSSQEVSLSLRGSLGLGSVWSGSGRSWLRALEEQWKVHVGIIFLGYSNLGIGSILQCRAICAHRCRGYVALIAYMFSTWPFSSSTIMTVVSFLISSRSMSSAWSFAVLGRIPALDLGMVATVPALVACGVLTRCTFSRKSWRMGRIMAKLAAMIPTAISMESQRPDWKSCLM